MNKSNQYLHLNTIDEYHQCFSEDIQIKLQQIRQTILQAAPHATETISYSMPAFKLKKVLVYYAVCKNHIGFYPTPKPIVHFQEQLQAYKTTKGAIQFPLDQKLPLALIKKMVKFRVADLLKEGK